MGRTDPSWAFGGGMNCNQVFSTNFLEQHVLVIISRGQRSGKVNLSGENSRFPFRFVPLRQL